MKLVYLLTHRCEFAVQGHTRRLCADLGKRDFNKAERVSLNSLLRGADGQALKHQLPVRAVQPGGNEVSAGTVRIQLDLEIGHR